MGAIHKLSAAALEEASDERLSCVRPSEKNMWKDKSFHVDHQGLTSGDPTFHRIALQVNKQTDEDSLAKLKGKTIGIAVVRADQPINPADVRAQLLGSITGLTLEKNATRNAIIARGGNPYAHDPQSTVSANRR